MFPENILQLRINDTLDVYRFQFRVVPESAAALVLRAGDVITTVAGVDIRQWSLDNINRLLQIHSRMKIQIRPRAEATPGPQLRNSDLFIEQGDSMSKTASCYASIEGHTDDVHALECTPAAFGEDLPAFSVDGPDFALPVMVAQPLEHCKIDQRFNASGHALLVSRQVGIHTTAVAVTPVENFRLRPTSTNTVRIVVRCVELTITRC